MSQGVLRGVEWRGDLASGCLHLLDQTRLPGEVVVEPVTDLEHLRQAIVDLVVRGAPAIAIAAAYGTAQHCLAAADRLAPGASGDDLDPAFSHALERLGSSRPTAINLSWALRRLRDCFDSHVGMLTARELAARLLLEARRIHREDEALCRRISEHGAAILPPGQVLTICNTGALAAGGAGTALGCIRAAHAAGTVKGVYACETRPLLQGARLTAIELQRAGVPVTLVTDGMAGALMASGRVTAVIVGADRITANGDTANKIGTYALAVLARHHGLPFFVAAPYSTFDLATRAGAEIPIEERDADEVRAPRGCAFAPRDVPVWNPAFDVTPAALITGIITERGVIEAPDTERVAAMIADTAAPPAF